MHSYWGWRKNATVHDLASHAICLTMLQHSSRNTDTPRHKDKTDSQDVNTGHRGENVNNISSNSS